MAPARTFPDGTQPNIIFRAVFAVLCSAIGAIGLSGVVAGLYTLMDPSWSKHTTSGLVFLLSVPVGTMIGGAFGFVWVKYETPDRTAGLVLVAAGGVATSMSLLDVVSSAREFTVLGFILRSVAPSCAVPLVASVITLVRGALLLKRHKPEEEKEIGNRC